MDSLLSFPVGLFHPLQHAGLARRTRDTDLSGLGHAKQFCGSALDLKYAPPAQRTRNSSFWGRGFSTVYNSQNVG